MKEYAARWRACQDCGKWLRGHFPPVAPIYCLECKLDHAKRAAIDMANKSGPYYDQWLKTRGPQGRPRT